MLDLKRYKWKDLVEYSVDFDVLAVTTDVIRDLLDERSYRLYTNDNVKLGANKLFDKFDYTAIFTHSYKCVNTIKIWHDKNMYNLKKEDYCKVDIEEGDVGWVIVPMCIFDDKFGVEEVIDYDDLNDLIESNDNEEEPEEGFTGTIRKDNAYIKNGVGIHKITQPTGEIFELNVNWESNLNGGIINKTNNLTNSLEPSSMISNTAVSESKVKEIIQQEFEKINLTNNLNSSTIDSSNDTNNNLFREENNMTNNPFATVRETNRRTVTIQLFDEDKGLDFEYSLVGQWKDILTEDSDQVTINELLMGGDVQEAIHEHNLIRQEQVNKEILSRTGQKVFLEPIRLKDLKWKII